MVSATASSAHLKKRSGLRASTPSSGTSPTNPLQCVCLFAAQVLELTRAGLSLSCSKQFGRPLASFQLVQKKLADAHMEAASTSTADQGTFGSCETLRSVS